MAELTVTKLHLMMMICKIKQGLFFCMSSIAPGGLALGSLHKLHLHLGVGRWSGGQMSNNSNVICEGSLIGVDFDMDWEY